MNYSLESIRKIQHEIWPLYQAAWAEVDQLSKHMELNPNWEQAFELEEAGMWRTYTARVDGELVGFICVVVQELLHSMGNYHAATDVAYVKPEHRGSFTTLMELTIDDLKDQGVKWYSFNLKAWDKRGGFLEKMDFKLHENSYQKVI